MAFKVGQRVLYDGSQNQGRGLKIKTEAVITNIDPVGIMLRFNDNTYQLVYNNNIKYVIKELSNGSDCGNPT